MPETQPNPIDILILPGLLTFFGLAVYLVVWQQTRLRERLGLGRWAGIVVLLLAVIAGWPKLWELVNPDLGFVYRTSIQYYGKKYMYSHYIGFLLPVLSLLVVAVLEFAYRRDRARI